MPQRGRSQFEKTNPEQILHLSIEFVFVEMERMTWRKGFQTYLMAKLSIG
jgi:hypothetical protein